MVLGFSKKELLAVTTILSLLGGLMFINMQASLRRSRDAQRKADVRDIYNGLIKFQADFGFFPASNNGRVVGCGGEEKDEKGNPIFHECEWGWESLQGYLERIPSDPENDKGYRYHYISNGKRFQIYASLESDEEPEYNTKIKQRNLTCGEKICNFGLGYSKTPLDKTLEEYEQELARQEKEN